MSSEMPNLLSESPHLVSSDLSIDKDCNMSDVSSSGSISPVGGSCSLESGSSSAYSSDDQVSEPEEGELMNSSDTNTDVSSMSREQFLNFQKKLLRLESDAEKERETKKTVQNGEGFPGVIGHLHVVAMQMKKFGRIAANVTFAPYSGGPLCPHGFKKGDNIYIYSGSMLCREEDLYAKGVVYEVTPMDVTVAVEETNNLDQSKSFSLKHDPSLESTERMLKGLQSMRDPRGRTRHLTEVLFKETNPLPPQPHLPPSLCRHGTHKLKLFNDQLDSSQQSAVEFILQQQDLAVLHGPPGTGKTTTLIEVIRQHVKLGFKVLALAPSNLGVDNLVERLDKAGLKVMRIGHPARTTPATQRHTLDMLLDTADGSIVIRDMKSEICDLQNELRTKKKYERSAIHRDIRDLRKDLRKRTERLTKELICGADVVLCTLLSAHKYGPLRHLKEDHFGLTVIDECSQGTEASCYTAVLRSPKLVMAGDHKQLPPTVISQQAHYLLTSLMERIISVYGSQVVRMLTVQYRMNDNIMRWSSDAMYGGNLMAHHSVNKHLLCHLPGVKETEHTDVPLLLIDTSDCPGFEETDTSNANGAPESKSNEGEALLVLGVIKRLLKAGVREDQVAVITPYSRQVKLVRSMVCGDHPDVEVQTVDGFQGREKEAVILTLVRSNDKGEIGFLSEDRRLNVAVTRARRHLAVVCNTRTLQQNDFLRGFMDYMAQHARLVRAETMEEANCTMLSADFSQIDLSHLLENPRKNNSHVEQEKSEEQKEKELEELKEKKIEKYRKILNKFVASSNRRHQFPSKISSYDRMLIHDIAESLALFHYSEGVDEKRHIVVSKEPKREAPIDGEHEICYKPSLEESEGETTSAEPSLASSAAASASHSEQSVKPKVKSKKKVAECSSAPPAVAAAAAASESTTKHCTLCGKNIPTMSYTTHRLACEKKEREAIAFQKKKLDARKREAESQADQELSRKAKNDRKTSKKQKQQQKVSNKDEPDEDDFDEIVSAFSASHSRCNVSGGCKSASNALLLQTCVWCHAAYCLAHHLAEAHGCGAHAKQQARATVLREGIIYPGSGVPSKLPHPDKRAQLQRQLDKKIAAMETGRKKNKKK